MRRVKEPAMEYLRVVEWSDEDDCYVGSAPPLIGRCCHGNDETKVYAELRQIVDEWIDLYQADGKPLPEALHERDYSGKFVLRVSPEVHKALAIRAAQEGDSLNHYCEQALTEIIRYPSPRKHSARSKKKRQHT
jgi:predicted HicB family RNase H-like nuclease